MKRKTGENSPKIVRKLEMGRRKDFLAKFSSRGQQSGHLPPKNSNINPIISVQAVLVTRDPSQSEETILTEAKKKKTKPMGGLVSQEGNIGQQQIWNQNNLLKIKKF